MSRYIPKSELSPGRQHLVELLQRINFGKIEKMPVRNGEPVLEPLPRIVREIKIGGENGPHPEARQKDFLLKSQVTELFGHLDDLGNGTVEMLEIKHGLPFRMLIAEPSA